jgi:hypothetical protein
LQFFVFDGPKERKKKDHILTPDIYFLFGCMNEKRKKIEKPKI